MRRNIEEEYARTLFQALEKRFVKPSGNEQPTLEGTSDDQEVRLTIEGGGIHWGCILTSHHRHAKISCAEIGRTDIKQPQYKGLMYDVTLYEEEYAMRGRAFEQELAFRSIEDWLSGGSKEEVYSGYSFIDARKKKLIEVLDAIHTHCPTLREAVDEATVKEIRFQDHILVELNDRSCEAFFYGYEEHPRFSFMWDQTEIFEQSTGDNATISKLIQDWVANALMPSALRLIYQDIDFGKLGEYYEQGKGIEGEFILSWKYIESLYQELDYEVSAKMLVLVRQLQEMGYASKFRAGTSMYSLMLSRSRRHGLRSGQGFVLLKFFDLIHKANQKKALKGLLKSNESGKRNITETKEIQDFVKDFERDLRSGVFEVIVEIGEHSEKFEATLGVMSDKLLVNLELLAQEAID